MGNKIHFAVLLPCENHFLKGVYAMSSFTVLNSLDVSDKIEKKNGLSY